MVGDTSEGFMNIEISPKEYERELNWNDAIFYCSLLTIDNKNDWRLPIMDELDYIYNLKNDFVYSFYWSSLEGTDRLAWGKNMDYGRHYNDFKNGTNFVRAVRTI